MASTVVRTTLRLDQTRNAAKFENTETAVGGSETTVLDKFDCALFNRYAIQIFNSDGSVAGTAKVYGDRTILFYYLFRKPITFIRQLIGI